MIRVEVDPTVPPGTAELRDGDRVVARIENLSLWKALPEQGPRSRCSVRGCNERAVAMYDGRRRRWACRKHLPDAELPRG